MKYFSDRFLSPLLLILIFNLSVFLGTYVSPILFLTLAILLFLPGYLLLRILKLGAHTNRATYLYSFGLSIIYIMAVGCLSSVIGGIHLKELLYIINISLVMMFIAGKGLPLPNVRSINYKITARNAFCIALLILIFVSTFAGSSILNNGGSGTVSICIFIIAPIIVVFELWFIKNGKASAKLLPWILFVIAATFMLSYSMRSNHILGYDINHEFSVFQAAVRTGKLKIVSSDPYTACLSLTALPAVLHYFSPISDEYIFKLLYPLLAAAIPVVLYYIYLEISSKRWLAFLSSILFVIQAQFLNQLPALARQEIGFIFFSLLILVLVDKKLKRIQRNTLFILFSIGMTVSHYSTSYVAFLLFLVGYILFKLIRLAFKNRMPNTTQEKYFIISGKQLAILGLLGVLWYAQLTTIGSNIPNIFTQITSNIGNSLSSDERSSTVNGALSLSENNPQISISSFSSTVNNQFPNQNNIDNIYFVPPGQSRSLTDNVLVKSYFQYFLPIFFRLLLLAGFCTLLYIWLKRNVSTSYVAITLSALIMLVLIIILPQISVDYNLERLYQQILIILAPIMSLGLYSIYKIFKYRSFAIALSIFILICYLWSNSGLVSQIISGQDDLIFSNVGNAYDTFYTHNGEIFALQWLAEQNIKPEYISIDLYSSLKANAYTNLNVKQINKLMVPAKLADSKLIYEGQTNMTEGRTFFLFNNNVVSFNYPTVYLSGNKNKIFTDNSGTVYQ